MRKALHALPPAPLARRLRPHRSGETLEILDGTGTALRIARGIVWITMERDTRDIVLAAGDTLVIDRPGLTLIAAQAPTTLCAMTRGSKARPRRVSARPRAARDPLARIAGGAAAHTRGVLLRPRRARCSIAGAPAAR